MSYSAAAAVVSAADLGSRVLDWEQFGLAFAPTHSAV